MPLPGPLASRATIGGGSGWVPVGPLVFKTSRRGAPRGAVGSTPMRSRHEDRPIAATEPSRARPPSVERVLVSLRSLAPGVDHVALLRAAREAVGDEVIRLQAGEAPREPAALATVAAERLDAAGRIAIEAVINATGVIVHTNLGR